MVAHRAADIEHRAAGERAGAVGDPGGAQRVDDVQRAHRAVRVPKARGLSVVELLFAAGGAVPGLAHRSEMARSRSMSTWASR